MNTKLPPKAEFQVNPNVMVGQIPALGELERRLVPEQAYRLRFPSGIVGELMTLKGGELKGLKTTSVMGADGIVAVAGLEPIDVTPEVALNVLNLWHFNELASQINYLAHQIAQIERVVYQQSKAKLDSIFFILQDISRSVPNCLGDSPSASQFKAYLFTQLANVKKDICEYFQFQLQAFEQFVGQQCGKMNVQARDWLIYDFEKLSSHPVFKALEMEAVVALFEVVIDGRFSNGMLSLAKGRLKDRSDQIGAHIERYSQWMGTSLNHQQFQSRQQLMTHEDHRLEDQAWADIFSRSQVCHQQISAVLNPLEKVFLPGLDGNEIELLCLTSMNGMLQISKSS